MASLTGNLVAETYKALLKTIDNDILTASEKQITDGLGGGSNVFIDSNGFLRANKYKVTNGLATQFLKADGSLDTNSYLTSITGAQVITALGYTPVTNQRTLTINGVGYNLSADRSWTVEGTAAIWGNITGTLSNQTDLQAALNAKFNVPTGTVSQYIRGDGSLAVLPTGGGGGGGSVSYYLNGSINQGTIGGVAYYEMNKVPIIGTGTDFSRNSNGYIASFLTDANDPNLLQIPAGNWNFETYLQASNGGGSPNFYIQLYKYDGTNFTLIASNSGTPKLINDGANIEAYYSALAVPETTLTLTDRLAVRIYVNTAGRTITMHTENGHLCEVITTFTTGLTALNGLTAQVQYLSTGTSGNDFNISSATNTHTFNLPTASAVNRGALSAADWIIFNAKQAQLDGTGFVKASGTTISYDNSTYLTTADAASTYQLLTNLSTDLTASATKYPSVNAVIAGLATKQPLDADLTAIAALAGTSGFLIKTAADTWSLDTNTYLTTATAASTYQRLDKMVSNLLASDTEYPNSNAVLAKLALKADAANPVFTGDLSISGATPRLYFVDTDQNPDYTVFVDSGFFYIYDQTAGATRFSINSSGNISTGVGKSITAGSFVRDGGTASQYLMADGSVSSGPANGITGSLTTGYIPKASGANTLTNSLIFDNGTKVAIGNAAPDTRFQVVGSHTSGRGILELFSSDDCLIALRKGTATSGLRFQSSTGTDNWFFGDLTAGDIVLQENFSTTRFTMFKGGNFVIGNGGDAGFKLDVNGTGRFSTQLSIGTGTQAINTDAELTLKDGVAFAGLDFKSARTSGNLGGLRFYNTASDSVPISQILVEADSKINFYNGTSGSEARLTIASSGAATFSSSLRANGDITYYNGVNLNVIITNGAADKGRMYLYSSGNADIGFQSGGGSWFLNSLGVGTNSPQVKLNTFFSGNLDTIQIRAETDVSSVVSYLGIAPSILEFYRNIDTGVDLTIQTKVGGGSSGGNIVFAPNGGTSLTPVPRMRIFKSGRVAIGDTGANGLLQLTGSHPSGYGMLNMNSTDACIISLDSSGSYDVRLRFKYQGIDKWFAGMATSDIWELQMSNGGAAIKANQSGDVFLYDRLAVGTGSFTGSAKFLLGTPLSSGSGAIAQINGFIRVRDQIILHNQANTSLDAYLSCTGLNALTTGGTLTATAFFESSDSRLKTLIDGSAQIKGIENLEAKLYEKNGKIELGYFAQDAQEFMPYSVEKNMDGFLSLSYREVHTAKIARLEQRVAELEKQLNAA